MKRFTIGRRLFRQESELLVLAGGVAAGIGRKNAEPQGLRSDAIGCMVDFLCKRGKRPRIQYLNRFLRSRLSFYSEPLAPAAGRNEVVEEVCAELEAFDAAKNAW